MYLTLRGQYGARSTRTDPNDGATSVMHVAAPLMQDGRIIGSLIAWWVSRSIKTLQHYTVQVANGENVQLPPFRSSELAQLGQSVEHMRQQLEGKTYVEQYVHSLTHELKSPLTAIKSSAELLQENPPEAVRERFTRNIHNQTTRLQLLIDRLLQLASIERTPKLSTQSVALGDIIQNAVHSVQAIATQRQITLNTQLTHNPKVAVDQLLLTQAIVNVLDNAIDFSSDGARIDIYDEASLRAHHLIIRDYGAGIPDYTLDKIFDRFYSLARPHTPKSTGLGLSFVREIMRKHGGDVEIANHPQGGVLVRLILPK